MHYGGFKVKKCWLLGLQEMEAEIARFHKNNAALDLTLSEYRLKENGLQKEILRQRHSMSDGEQVIKWAPICHPPRPPISPPPPPILPRPDPTSLPLLTPSELISLLRFPLPVPTHPPMGPQL